MLSINYVVCVCVLSSMTAMFASMPGHWSILLEICTSSWTLNFGS